jgi:DNA-binding LacI/PurR family transcriptional regulator
MATQPKRKPGRSRTNSNTKGLLSQIRELAYAKGPDAKLPTTEDLCVSYKTSKATLNTVLKTLEGQNIITRRQGSGIYVSPRIHRKAIAVVTNSRLIGVRASPFWGSLLGEFAVHVQTRGLATNHDFEFYITSPSPEPHGELPDLVKRSVREGAVHGVVAIGLNVDSARWLMDQGIPCVAYAGGSKWTVVTAGEPFIQAGIQALADQGCRRIEYWGLPRPDDANPEWYQQTVRAVEAAFGAIGIEPPQTLVGPSEELLAGCKFPHGLQLAPHRAYTAIKALYRDPALPKPDGIFVGDDIMASAILHGLVELGVRIGDDIKIVSHANRTSPILFGTQPNIIMFEYDPAEIAGALIQLLDQAMEDPDLPEVEICVPWRVRLPGESDGPTGDGA